MDSLSKYVYSDKYQQTKKYSSWVILTVVIVLVFAASVYAFTINRKITEQKINALISPEYLSFADADYVIHQTIDWEGISVPVSIGIFNSKEGMNFLIEAKNISKGDILKILGQLEQVQ